MSQNSKVDFDLDGLVDGHPGNAEEQYRKNAIGYAEQLAVQLRKGFLTYCVLQFALMRLDIPATSSRR